MGSLALMAKWPPEVGSSRLRIPRRSISASSRHKASILVAMVSVAVTGSPPI
jgi:hypothetical protein